MAFLKLDCENGISGDMLVATLLDLGADVNKLVSLVKSLGLNGYELKISKVLKNGMSATDFDVVLSDENHDHDMKYLYGDSEQKINFKGNRTYRDIESLINSNDILSDKVKNISLKIFSEVAEAESFAHGVKKEDVVFHETGAMDSIIDIVSIAICLDDLNIEKVFVTNLREGSGEINTRVGKLPIPTPVVRYLSSKFDLSIEQIDLPYELITPTGLASLCVVSDFEKLKNDFVVLKTGYGAGKRNYSEPLLKSSLIKID